MRKRNDGIIVYYKCLRCGNEFSIPRYRSRKRGKGHIKDLWCPWCKVESKFTEIGIW